MTRGALRSASLRVCAAPASCSALCSGRPALVTRPEASVAAPGALSRGRCYVCRGQRAALSLSCPFSGRSRWGPARGLCGRPWGARAARAGTVSSSSPGEALAGDTHTKGAQQIER